MRVAKRVDDLYGLPLEEFTKARDELAKELKGAGKKEAADEVKALRKPSVSAWTVNQLARRRPEEMRALVKAGDGLRKAQRAAVGGGGPEALRDATNAHRDRLDELTSAARDELGAGTATLQRVVQTLRAASVDKEASKTLLAGTLAGDVEQSGFGQLLAAVPPGGFRAPPRRKPEPKQRAKAKAAAPAARPKPAPKQRRDPNAARRKRLQEQLDKARARVQDLESQLEKLGG
jgi:hypothetical protein